jgi:hypothetical protein
LANTSTGLSPSISISTGSEKVFRELGYVAYGSLADKPSPAKIHLCPLLSESGQNVAAPRMSAKCQERTFKSSALTKPGDIARAFS